MRERFANNAVTTLATTITTAATTLTVANASRFPQAGQFRILVGGEIMVVTNVTGSVFTVLRGAEGDTPTGHVTGESVAQIASAGSQTRWMRDSVPGADGDRPPYQLLDAAGNTLTSASFAQVNAASYATISDSSTGDVVLSTTPSGYSAYAIALGRAMPAGKTLIAALRPILQAGPTPGYMFVGVGFRESATGKLAIFGPQNYNGSRSMLVRHYTNPTSLSGTPFSGDLWIPGADALWLKLTDDGTNLTFYVGDGTAWVTLYSEAVASFFTTAPDQFIFGTNASGSLPIVNRLVAWQEQ